MIHTLSPSLASIPNLEHFLGDKVRLGLPMNRNPNAVMAGWGRKRSYRWASYIAELRGVPCISLEDGFLRSVGMGRQEATLSLVIDDVGIHYDATMPSRLEMLIARDDLDATGKQRARDIASAWRLGRLSKYNHARESGAELQTLPPGFVLVVDQTFGDASIGYGLASPASFQLMLEAALDEHPNQPVVLKVHPEVFAGRKKGHFASLSPGQASRVRVLATDLHPPCLLERADAVYCVTSQMGFEALVWGKPVRTFGMPFYAGWGLTQDEVEAPDRRHPVALETLIHAALVDYPRYVDPETGMPCQVERVMEYLAFQRAMRQRLPEQINAMGFGMLRRPLVKAFFDGSTLHHLKNMASVPAGRAVAVWGRSYIDGLPEPEGRHTITLEDGFLRSVGLGAELVRPLSLVMDPVGIYYDATSPSLLENILQQQNFAPELLARAAVLRARIVESGLTKYNLAGKRWLRPAEAKRVILVPGQVESDASIRFGSPHVRTNLALLKAVREANPDAYLVYKPHPDVEAGLRLAGQGEEQAGDYCDARVSDVAMEDLFEQIDEVHVLTSLAGFEALLRGKPVATYGQPFYAGWGLTQDRYPVARRTRRLSLDELVAGVLILYPTYVSQLTGRYTTPEQALNELLALRKGAALKPPLRRIALRSILRIWAKVEGRFRKLHGRN